jgi:hypothetical protein
MWTWLVILIVVVAVVWFIKKKSSVEDIGTKKTDYAQSMPLSVTRNNNIGTRGGIPRDDSVNIMAAIQGY